MSDEIDRAIQAAWDELRKSVARYLYLDEAPNPSFVCGFKKGYKAALSAQSDREQALREQLAGATYLMDIVAGGGLDGEIQAKMAEQVNTNRVLLDTGEQQ